MSQTLILPAKSQTMPAGHEFLAGTMLVNLPSQECTLGRLNIPTERRDSDRFPRELLI